MRLRPALVTFAALGAAALAYEAGRRAERVRIDRMARALHQRVSALRSVAVAAGAARTRGAFADWPAADDPMTCPADRLSWLAFDAGVVGWDDAWPEAQQREVIREAHRAQAEAFRPRAARAA